MKDKALSNDRPEGEGPAHTQTTESSTASFATTPGSVPNDTDKELHKLLISIRTLLTDDKPTLTTPPVPSVPSAPSNSPNLPRLFVPLTRLIIPHAFGYQPRCVVSEGDSIRKTHQRLVSRYITWRARPDRIASSLSLIPELESVIRAAYPLDLHRRQVEAEVRAEVRDDVKELRRERDYMKGLVEELERERREMVDGLARIARLGRTARIVLDEDGRMSADVMRWLLCLTNVADELGEKYTGKAKAPMADALEGYGDSDGEGSKVGSGDTSDSASWKEGSEKN